MTAQAFSHEIQRVPGKANVLIADDSIVVRGLFSRWINQHPGMHVAGIATDGVAAIRLATQLRPDLIILDLDMPVMDGLSALPEIQKASPASSVIIASSLTARSARLSLQCLALGATDILPKPGTSRDLVGSQSFQQEVIDKLEGLLGIDSPVVSGRSCQQARAAKRPVLPATTFSQVPRGPSVPLVTPRPELIVIAASTGGPNALMRVLDDMGDVPEKVPVIIIQHMSRVFTASLAEQLQATLRRPVREADHGELPVPGTIYIAPGGQHLRLASANSGITMNLDASPPVKYCRPAADVTFKDAALAAGASTLAVVLTGMGSDGLEGVRDLRATGATVIAQDQATSVVWGMPGAIAREGLAQHVLPLGQIGGAIRSMLSNGAAP